MTITFLLPGIGGTPIGGVKVVYEYANRFVKDGYDVNIIYPASALPISWDFKDKLKSLPRFLKYFKCKKFGTNWFNLDNRVREIVTYNLYQNNVPDSDFYVATAVQTAYALEKYNINNSRKIYLIQDFENWRTDDASVCKSYSFGFKNLVISKWLYDLVSKYSTQTYILPNGFDFEYFRLIKSVESRDPYNIAMLYHTDARKGVTCGLEALKKAKEIIPQLRATLFGVPPRPEKLPAWIAYKQRPSQKEHNEIYNEASVFIAPSIVEGWGLTVGEAMICGAAIICTDALGFAEMVEHNKSAIICPANNSQSMADSIVRLVNDNSLRIRLATEGNKSIKKFDWESSYMKFKEILETCNYTSRIK